MGRNNSCPIPQGEETFFSGENIVPISGRFLSDEEEGVQSDRGHSCWSLGIPRLTQLLP